MMTAFLQRWALKALISVVLLLGVGLYGFHTGVQHQRGIDAENVVKVDKQITQQNNSLQATADKSASQTIVYKDRIVTKYKTINQGVVHYAQTNPNASNLLDSDFIGLHDRAASANGEDTIAGSARNADGSASSAPVTKADAIRIIAGNYKRYYECRQQVTDWISFYTDLRTQVNGKDGE